MKHKNASLENLRPFHKVQPTLKPADYKRDAFKKIARQYAWRRLQIVLLMALLLLILVIYIFQE